MSRDSIQCEALSQFSRAKEINRRVELTLRTLSPDTTFTSLGEAERLSKRRWRPMVLSVETY